MDDVTATINNMLTLNGDVARDLADVLHYHKTQAVSGDTSTAYKIYTAELQRHFSDLGELMLALGGYLAG